jgi:hypothetical protein
MRCWSSRGLSRLGKDGVLECMVTSTKLGGLFGQGFTFLLASCYIILRRVSLSMSMSRLHIGGLALAHCGMEWST